MLTFPSAPFFQHFGEPVQFGDVTARGILDAPSREIDFSGVEVTVTDWSLTFGTEDLDIKSGDTLTVGGKKFRVSKVQPLPDDGVLSKATLVKLNG